MRISRWMLTVPTTLAAMALASPCAAIGEPEASPTGKGITGGALLGAELVLATEAAFDLEPTWLYWVGGAVGAGAGAYGGYYVEQTGSAQWSMLLLAGGMALAIPTTVAVLDATAYEPPASVTEDDLGPNEPLAEPPQVSHSTLRRTRVSRLGLRAPALVDWNTAGTLSLSVPSLEVREVYSLQQRAELGVDQQTEFRMPVFKLIF